VLVGAPIINLDDLVKYLHDHRELEAFACETKIFNKILPLFTAAQSTTPQLQNRPRSATSYSPSIQRIKRCDGRMAKCWS